MSTTEIERIEAQRSGSRERMSLGSRLIDLVIAVMGMAMVLAVATVPLVPRQQAMFAVGTAIIFFIANRFAGRAVTLFLVVLSLAVSLRYIFWRVTETLDFPTPLELFLGTGLALAEVYAITVLVLGYVQSVWPLNRRPMPLPDDPEVWPTVDVYIPTYNEPMSVVRATVLAAMAIDWPRDKMRVWLLDDGRREEFRDFAEACGCGYITRKNNLHAKAGNLNNAMKQTDGEFICIFDCDHIPTRAFLQMTMGWLVAEPNLALVQTPHHFYSPDPFQRNLAAGTRVPAEGNMFYGLVQDGNDYWNACFFCGSCAVLRRSALEEIGGIAVETVTEDAHTMLKLHRRGWDSAYLKLPLAAGLATERLMLHIGQRIRWARGMIQILRIDNPLFGRGLTIGQRLCYLQAMGHFLFAIPRLVFLTSPLAYLLLGQNIISASPLAITAYALPHIFHSVATNSRVQQQWRHSFWSEIYETVLALFLVRVTLVTIASPRRGKFNVTAKGGLLENGFFDLSAVYPNLILAFLLIAGVVRGIVTLTVFKTETLIFQALLLNTIWASLSLLVVLAALAVGRETRQIRSRARIAATVPVAVYMADGRVVNGVTRDLSQGGGSLMMDRPNGFVDNTDVEIEFAVGDGPIMVPARALRWDGQTLQVRWQPQTIEEEARVVQAVFGRADAWTDWAAFPRDRPLYSLWRVLVSIRGLFRPRDRSPAPRPPGAGGNPTLPGPETQAVAEQGRTRALAGSVAAVVALLLLSTVALHAQPRGQTTIRPIPQAVTPLQGPLPGPAPLQPAVAQQGTLPAQAVPPPPLPGQLPTAGPPSAAQAPLLNGLTDANRPGTRRVVFNLRQLGAQGPLALRGTSELQGVEFGIRADEVVTAAQLTLSGATSPNLIPEFSNVTVTLNEQYVGTIPVNREQPNFQIDMPVSPVFFQDNNRLNFRFTGRYAPECNDPLSGLLWATVYDTSTLTLTLERLPPQRDLARLPLPFFDRAREAGPDAAVRAVQQAEQRGAASAGITASWFGQQAAFRGANFPVVNEPPSDGNAVMVVIGAEGRGSNFLPPINGPTLAVIPNPNDSLSSILMIAGRNGDEVDYRGDGAHARQSCARQRCRDRAACPKWRNAQPYDAPNWIATNRPVKFGELVDAADLQSYGYVRTAARPVPHGARFLHMAQPRVPDERAIPRTARPRHRRRRRLASMSASTASISTRSRWHPWSAATAGFRGLLDFGVSQADAHVDIPTYDIFGNNDLQFYFDARPLHRGDCVAIPNDLRMSIDPDSTVDLSRGYRFTPMPNLAFFVNSGFPFTVYADLSQTAVIIPDRPSTVEVSAFLNLMGRIGALTGFPVVRMLVVRPDGVAAVADRDLLMIGTMQRLQGAAELFRNAPVRMDGSRLNVALSGPLDSVRRIFGDRADVDRERATTTLSAGLTEGTAALIGSESPLKSGRSMVAIVAAAPQGLEGVITTFRDSEQAPLIQGDLALLTGGRVTSYRVGSVYTVGTLPFWLWPSWALRDQPFSIVIVMLVGCFLLGLALYWAMRRRASGRLSQTSVR